MGLWVVGESAACAEGAGGSANRPNGEHVRACGSRRQVLPSSHLVRRCGVNFPASPATAGMATAEGSAVQDFHMTQQQPQALRSYPLCFSSCHPKNVKSLAVLRRAFCRILGTFASSLREGGTEACRD